MPWLYPSSQGIWNIEVVPWPEAARSPDTRKAPAPPTPGTDLQPGERRVELVQWSGTRECLGDTFFLSSFVYKCKNTKMKQIIYLLAKPLYIQWIRKIQLPKSYKYTMFTSRIRIDYIQTVCCTYQLSMAAVRVNLFYHEKTKPQTEVNTWTCNNSSDGTGQSVIGSELELKKPSLAHCCQLHSLPFCWMALWSQCMCNRLIHRNLVANTFTFFYPRKQIISDILLTVVNFAIKLKICMILRSTIFQYFPNVLCTYLLV